MGIDGRCGVSESAWLIEFKGSGNHRAMWFTGSPDGLPFSEDSLEAIRFSRREDARRLLEGMLARRKQAATGPGESALLIFRLRLGGDNYTVTEHMWCGPAEGTGKVESP
jgi:hypothetical protein